MVLKNPDEHQIGKTLVYFVRHGERIHLPGTPHPHDFGLSEKGKKEAKEIAKKFSKIKEEIDFLYSSPMKRAYETAIEIGKEIKKKPRIIKNFEEVQGILEHPNGFSKDYWKERINFEKKRKIFDEILEKNRGKVIVIVSHSRLSRMLFGRKIGLSYKKSKVFDLNNCHINLMRFKGKKLDYIYCINGKDLK